MAQTRSATGYVMGVFPDLDAARDAMSAVEAQGIDASDIHLGGATAGAAAHDRYVGGRDRNVKRFVAARTVPGLLVGMAIGVVFGLVVGAILGGPLFVYVLIGWIMGGAWGWAIGGYSALRNTEEWELTFEPGGEGEVAVAVRSPREDVLDTAEQALRSSGARRVERH